jgi:hypothetical protein
MWAPWIVSTFGEGELSQAVRPDHLPIRSLSDRGRALLASEVTIEDESFLAFEQGELGESARALGKKPDSGSRVRYDVLTTACAKFLAVSGNLVGHVSDAWLKQVPTIPQTRIDVPKGGGDLRIRFPKQGDFSYPLGRTLDSVVTFGPGITGDTFVADMTGHTGEVHLVSDGVGAVFSHKWIRRQLLQRASGIEVWRRAGALARMVPGVPLNQVRLPETYFYDRGIAASIGDIAVRTVRRNKPVDVVVMSSVHTAGQQEVEAGIDGAHQLLKEGGVLVVKAPRTSVGNEGGMDVAASRAIPIFGNPVAAGDAGYLDQHIDPSLPRRRPADFAIFQK